jgi:hypothetical protein
MTWLHHELARRTRKLTKPSLLASAHRPVAQSKVKHRDELQDSRIHLHQPHAPQSWQRTASPDNCMSLDSNLNLTSRTTSQIQHPYHSHRMRIVCKFLHSIVVCMLVCRGYTAFEGVDIINAFHLPAPHLSLVRCCTERKAWIHH